MKKLMTLVLLLAFTTMSFAQKNEIKAIEKAIKGSNYGDAKSAVAAAEALEGSMDDKLKSKFYFLKAKALYAEGQGSDSDIDSAIASLDKLKDLESSMGKLKYTDEANEMKTGMLNSFLTKANDAFNNKDYKVAAKRFEKVYKMSPTDTLYLYYAASAAVTDQDYDSALDYYVQLKNMGYTGVQMNYYATNKESGVEESFPGKEARDLSVRIAKSHNNPRDVKSDPKTAEIVKNIALIYVSQGKNEKALGAMADARAENPDDLGLLLSEANVHLKMGNRDKFKDLMEQATQKDPNNAELLYNLGVLAAEGGNLEESKKYYKKAIEINPNYVDAYNNIAVAILEGEAAIVEEMNGLGTSAADNKKYDELKEKRSQLYQDAIPYLEKALELRNTNIDAARTLMNIYSALAETEKFKAMRARVEQMEASAGGN
ncbi:tetratricopeptide repeat protein [Winogradskyella echinorum]|uniref:Tetratricopeptide repeat protein n=1 Tax=Winogradskyella echinorum TaxID=538189 RepID=A0ABR6Y1G5_9FLAO|nr:tetratricopeptide repeat protein [Winogradskyella echinorum]MBC3846563.1 tetratricopeptide repeat protein [Winogradskyella echinorum]MBC5750911.1 tetratricopeptide repeat protein [Winogradskyella echinorum]